MERNACYTRNEFTLPGNPVDSSAIAPFIIRYYIGSDIPLADDDTIAALMDTAEFAEMPVYPYYGSVRMIDGTVVVKLS